jgi:hypothetical protein
VSLGAFGILAIGPEGAAKNKPKLQTFTTLRHILGLTLKDILSHQ